MDTLVLIIDGVSAAGVAMGSKLPCLDGCTPRACKDIMVYVLHILHEMSL